MSGPLEIRTEREGATRLRLSGELDLSCGERFEEVVRQELVLVLEQTHPVLIIDLSAVTFIDSSGIRMLLGVWRESQSNGFALQVVPGGDQVQRVFALTGTDKVLPLVDSDVSDPADGG
jgi:anti-sigma B factor antagonist